MKKGQKIATVIVLLVVLLLGLVIVAILPQSIDYRKKLDKANALLKAEGMPVTVTELAAATKVPAESNAAPLFDQAYGMLSKDDARGPQSLRLHSQNVDSPSAETRELKRLGPALSVTARAANLPNCIFPKDFGKGEEVLLPEFSYMRTLERWTNWRAKIELQSGQTAEALTDLNNALKISNQSIHTPFFIGALIGVSMRREELEATWPEICAKPLSPSRIKALMTIDQAPLELNAKRAYMSDVPLMSATLNSEKPGDLLNGIFGGNDQRPPLNVQLQGVLSPNLLKLQWKADFADVIANLVRALPTDGSITGLDVSQCNAIEAAYKKDASPGAFLVNMIDPGSMLESMRSNYLSFLADQRMHWLGAQLLLGHRPNTEWPASPPAFWPKVIDPNSGSPFTYTKTKKGFRIMSSNLKEPEESRLKLEYPISPESPPQAIKPPGSSRGAPPPHFPRQIVSPNKRLRPPTAKFAVAPAD